MKKVKLIIVACCIPAFCAVSKGQGIQWLAKPKYEQILPFSGNTAPVQFHGKWGYINAKGEEILQPEYEKVYDFKEGIGIVTSADNEIKFLVDGFGNKKEVAAGLKPYSRSPFFSDGLLLVTNGGKWGYLNKSGRLVIDCRFYWALPFNEKKAAVSISKYGVGQWAYIDTEGKAVISTDSNFDWALSFFQGKAVVVKNNKPYFIDSKGKILKDEKLSSLKIVENEIRPFGSFSGAIKCTAGDIIFRGDGVLDKINLNGDTFSFIPNQEKAPTQLSVAESIKANRKSTFIIDGKELPALFDKILWNNDETAIVENAGRLGLVLLLREDILAVMSNSDTVYSVFGNINPAVFKINNRLSTAINNIEILFPDGKSQQIDELKPNGSEEVEWQIPADFQPGVRKTNLNVTCDGIGIYNFDFNLFIKDKPSLLVRFPKDQYEFADNNSLVSFEIYNGSVYNANGVEVRVTNTAKTVNYLNTIVNINTQDKTSLSFKIPVTEEKQKVKLKIYVQPPNHSPVILSDKELTLIKTSSEETNEDIIIKF